MALQKLLMKKFHSEYSDSFGRLWGICRMTLMYTKNTQKEIVYILRIDEWNWTCTVNTKNAGKFKLMAELGNKIKSLKTYYTICIFYTWCMQKAEIMTSLASVPFYDILHLKGQCHQIRMALKWGSFQGLS